MSIFLDILSILIVTIAVILLFLTFEWYQVLAVLLLIGLGFTLSTGFDFPISLFWGAIGYLICLALHTTIKDEAKDSKNDSKEGK